MPEQRTRKQKYFYALRNILIAMAVILTLFVAVSGIAFAAVWGHYWDFQADNVDSETCGNCHVMETYVESTQNNELLASFHASRSVGCTDCHDYSIKNQISETISYLKDDGQKPVLDPPYAMDQCFQCHEHGSYDQIAWRTTDLGVTDAQASGHSANPHQPPHFTNLECNNCHFIHAPQTLLCSECHTYEFKYP